MKLVNENINKYLYPPSREDVEKRLENADISPMKLLQKSIEANYLKGVKRALNKGRDVPGLIDYSLEYAAKYGSLKIIKYLVEELYANINSQENTPLIKAVQWGHLDVVKYLVEHGADIYNDDYYGWTPLAWAETREYEEIAEYLKSQMNKD